MSSTAASESSRSKVVVACDDDRETVALLEAALHRAGYTFFGVTSGAECLTLVTRVTPRLILLDIQMPLMDGFETCRQIRARRELKPVPIAFLTARKTVEDVRAGLAAGGNDFLIKPFDTEQLCRRVQHWVTRRVGEARAPATRAG